LSIRAGIVAPVSGQEDGGGLDAATKIRCVLDVLRDLDAPDDVFGAFVVRMGTRYGTQAILVGMAQFGRGRASEEEALKCAEEVTRALGTPDKIKKMLTDALKGH
jgi:hypothetical protein